MKLIHHGYNTPVLIVPNRPHAYPLAQGSNWVLMNDKHSARPDVRASAVIAWLATALL